MRLSFRSLASFAFVVLSTLFFAQKVDAATYTVCASGCDYTDINMALTFAVSGNDVIEVQGSGESPYNPATELFPLIFISASTTLTCSGGATIGQSSPTGNNLIFLSTSSTISGCDFGNVSLKTQLSSGVPSPGIRIIGNTFSSSATGTIDFVYGARDFEVANNVNINFMNLGATSTGGLIQGNTFYGRMNNASDASILTTSASSSRLHFLSNTFTSYVTGSVSASRLVVIDGYDQVFATNTLKYGATSPSSFDTTLLFNASGTNYIAGNFIDTPSEYAICNGIRVTNPRNEPWTSVYTIAHNTVRANGNCWNSFPILARNTALGSTASSTLNFSYNLLFSSVTSSLTAYGITVLKTASDIPFTQTNSYNGAYRMGGVVKLEVTGVSATNVSAATSLTTNPFLKIDDVSSANDLQTADFSPYLDVNGSLDIGATSLARRTSIYLDDDGLIDYGGSGGVDATSTASIPHFLRTGDTVHLAAGTYRAFNVNSTTVTSSVSIVGAGASTIVDARENEDAITFTNVSSSSISTLYVRNASSTSSYYTATRMNFAFGGNDYNDGAAPLSIPSNATLYFTDPVACEISNYDSDGVTVTSILGTGNIHIGLVNIMGARVTFLVPNSVATSLSSLQNILDSNCGGAGTVDAFISSVFSKSGSVYSYQASAVSGASASLVAGVTSPPAITLNQLAYAGVKLAGTTNHITISSVTSTDNGYGISFATTANAYNTVSESEFFGSTMYDIHSLSNATNTFDNTDFTRASSTISGTGPILVKFNVRALTLRPSAAAIASVAITATDGFSAANSLGSTGASGYTSYASLPAYKLTSSSLALTNGGFNPYVVSSAATGYAVSSTTVNISSRNQVVTLYLVSTSAPSAPTSIAVTKGSTTSTIAWTDNADDEVGFTFDYINLSTGETFPGTVSSLSANSTSTVLSGLSPNVTYQARVQVTSTDLGSAHATTSAFTTFASTPDAPTVTVGSQTSVTISVNSNGNSTSTQYAIYHAAADRYLDGSGASSLTPTWQTTSSWATVTVTGLTCGTVYNFSTIGRNLDAIVTATSSAGTVTTSACSSSGGGGGGGGGGLSAGSGSGSSSLPASSLPVSSSPSLPALVPQVPISPPVISPQPAPSVILPPSTRVLTSVQTDIREFRLSLPAVAQQRIASFVEGGTTAVTQRLGEGERRALVRDWLDTVGVIPAAGIEAVIADLDRIASGQIPQGRNLVRERAQLTRVRQTFRTLYGRDPNFQNSQENLAWNTLMYRVRFPRDLQAERSGIQEFRATFRRAPQDPFQWATVRVMGYVQR